jgi:threonine/homoserine/homoserine lactone efflux protein
METLLPLVGFAFASSITPGPNNLMLSASGIAFGLRRTLPHLAGVAFGFLVLLLVCGSGVGAVVTAFPAVAVALKLFGTLYLLYLAWSMRNALAPEAADASARPLRFVEAALFQFVNPKGWIMALTASSVFLPELEPRWLAVGLLGLVFLGVGLPCICAWAVVGVSLRRCLALERWRDFFSLMTGVLMLYAVTAMWIEV